MTDPLPAARLAKLRRIAAYQENCNPNPEDLAALLGEIDRLTAECEQLADFDALGQRGRDLQSERDRAVQRWHLQHERAETLEAENASLHARLGDSQAECGALQGELVKAFGERDTMHRRAYAAYVRADSIRVLAEQLRRLTRFQLEAEPESPGWGTADVLGRQILVAMGALVPFRAPSATPQLPADAQRETVPEDDGFKTYRCPTPCDADCEARCHEGHEVDYKQRHNVAECQARSAAREAYVRFAPEDEGIASADVQAQNAADAEPDKVIWRLPQAWCEIYGIDILDPDGWRTPTPQAWDQPVTLAEFRTRLASSTVRNAAAAWTAVNRDFYNESESR